MRCDAGDRDVGTFFRYLAEAVSYFAVPPQVPTFSTEAVVDVADFAREFFRVLAGVSPPVHLTLDDFHHVPEDSAMQEALRVGIEEAGVSLSVLILSRSEPPPSWARAILYGQVRKVGPHALRLSPEEHAGILSLHGRHLDAAQLERWHEHLGGWPAGAAWFASAPEDREEWHAEGVDSRLAGFFEREVLASLDEPSRRVLLATPWANSVTAVMAQALSGCQEAGEVLAKLAREGTFTESRVLGASLSGSEPVPIAYTYHPLFRDFLRSFSTFTLGAEAVNSLKRATAELVAQESPEEAVDLACEAQDWPLAERLLLENAPDHVARGQLQLLREGIERLPAARPTRGSTTGSPPPSCFTTPTSPTRRSSSLTPALPQERTLSAW